jgi:uncharacterized protein YlaN (UPF0358 family)
MKVYLGGLCIAAACLASWSLRAPDPVFAQTRVLRGSVTDGREPVRGAVVKLEDLTTLQVRSYITQRDGKYHFAGLSTDVDYQVWATREDKQSGKKILSKFNTSAQPIIDLKLE